MTGAGLHLEGLFRPSLAAGVAVFLKLVLMPVIAVALALQFGLTGSNLAVVTICSAVPTASSAYVLARQMGGDAPLLAQIITLQTILAAVTMPIAIALVFIKVSHQQRRLSHDRKVEEGMGRHGQPGRMAAVSQVAEDQADTENLADKIPVILKMNDRPDRR